MTEENLKQVFIPNLPTRVDLASKTIVPSLDLNPAAPFGTMTKLSAGPIQPRDLDALLDELADQAEKSESDDLILCVGDLSILAAFIHYMTNVHGIVNLMRWNRKEGTYDILELIL